MRIDLATLASILSIILGVEVKEIAGPQKSTETATAHPVHHKRIDREVAVRNQQAWF